VNKQIVARGGGMKKGVQGTVEVMRPKEREEGHSPGRSRKGERFFGERGHIIAKKTSSSSEKRNSLTMKKGK